MNVNGVTSRNVYLIHVPRKVIIKDPNRRERVDGVLLRLVCLCLSSRDHNLVGLIFSLKWVLKSSYVGDIMSLRALIEIDS